VVVAGRVGVRPLDAALDDDAGGGVRLHGLPSGCTDIAFIYRSSDYRDFRCARQAEKTAEPVAMIATGSAVPN
jgi:hypothetical protein